MTKATPKKKVIKRAQGTGKRQEALRWTLQRAGNEFGHDRTQLERRRRALGIEPGPDACFTSQDIAKMLFGDKEAETIGKIAAERKKIEIEIETLQRQRIPLEALRVEMEPLLSGIASIIKNSLLTDRDKEEILENLRDLPKSLKW